MYDKITATDLMTTPIATIFQHEPMKRVMEKFDSTQAWNLPVLNAENEYIGFVSKSSIFSNYRQQLQELPSNYS